MTSWGRKFLDLASSAFDINTATLSGAIDIIVIEHPDGTLVSSPFHVRFGKFQVLKSREKRVSIRVNGGKVDLNMKLGNAGEAFFVVPVEGGAVNRELATSPITSPRSLSPDAQSPEVAGKAKNMDPFDLNSEELPTPLKDSPVKVTENIASSLKSGKPRSGGGSKKVSIDDSELHRSSFGSQQSMYESAEEGETTDEPSTSRGSSSSEGDDELLKWNWGSLPVLKKSQSKPEGLAAMARTKNHVARKRLTLFEEDENSSKDAEGNTRVYGSIFKTGDAKDKTLREDEGGKGKSPKIESVEMGSGFGLKGDATRPRADSTNSLPEDEESGKSRYFSAEFLANPFQEATLELSLCGEALKRLDNSDMDDLREVFEEGRVSFEKMFEGGQNILDDPNLVVHIDGNYYPWRSAGPAIMSLLVFKKPPSDKIMDQLLFGDRRKRSTWKSWFWGGKGDEKPPLKLLNVSSPPPDTTNQKTIDRSADREGDLLPEPEELMSPGSPRSDNNDDDAGFFKSLRPSNEQLAALNLAYGPNTVEFSVSSRIQGVRTVASTIYLWKSTTKIVISDVDGTITRSDVLGHLMPIVGKDWSHAGVTSLYSNIRSNGYEIVYLTSRAIGQADTTRSYLQSVQQGEERLPQGPVVMSPDRLFTSFTREVIRRNPQSFKIACLKDIKSLFPEGYNPFMAGFGNRDTDAESYLAVGVPVSKTFLINPQGDIRVWNHTYRKSYSALNELFNEMFPPIKDEQAPEEDYSEFKYWRKSLYQEDLVLDLEGWEDDNVDNDDGEDDEDEDEDEEDEGADAGDDGDDLEAEAEDDEDEVMNA